MCGLAPAAGAAGWLEPAPLPQHAHTAKPGSSSSARGTMRLSTVSRGYKIAQRVDGFMDGFYNR